MRAQKGGGARPRAFVRIHRSVAESLDAPPALRILFAEKMGDSPSLLCFQDVNARSPRRCYYNNPESRILPLSRLFSIGSRTLTRKPPIFRASPA
jgi:hypothetical protein